MWRSVGRRHGPRSIPVWRVWIFRLNRRSHWKYVLRGGAMRSIILIFYLLFATAAFAQKIPTWNIQSYCRSKSMLGGGGGGEIYATCVDGETIALGELRESWNDYSAESRSQCLKVTGSGGVYSDLQACIEAAEAIRDAKRR
jgi:hypothetical protein